MLSDAYRTLGVDPTVTDAQLRAAHRQLAKRYHPDSNPGSPGIAAKFAAVQNAYQEVLEAREQLAAATPNRDTQSSASTSAGPAGPAEPRPSGPLDEQLAKLEREVRLQAETRRQAAAAAAARAAAEAKAHPEPALTKEQLGEYETTDSFTAIFDDAGAELAKWLGRWLNPED